MGTGLLLWKSHVIWSWKHSHCLLAFFNLLFFLNHTAYTLMSLKHDFIIFLTYLKNYRYLLLFMHSSADWRDYRPAKILLIFFLGNLSPWHPRTDTHKSQYNCSPFLHNMLLTTSCDKHFLFTPFMPPSFFFFPANYIVAALFPDLESSCSKSRFMIWIFYKLENRWKSET